MSQLEPSLVPLTGTLRDAMLALDRGARGIALIRDAGGRLAGVVTDGDLRRALLRGAALEDPLASIANRAFTAASPADGRAEVLDLMRARRISAVPVLDAERRPVGLHLLHEFVEPVDRSNWAVVMAGGQGIRLRPLTENIPKPMLRVAGRPILERIVLHLVGTGVRRIFISVNYLREQIEDYFGDGSGVGARIEYLREEEPLGTAGALGLLPSPPTETLLLLNGDLVTSADLGSLIAFHTAGGYAATIGVRRYLHTVPFGCIERDGNQVTALHEKPTLEREVNTGIYALEPSTVALVTKGVACSTPALVERLLEAGRPVGAFEVEEDWIDIGAREELARARGVG
jgi:dTDP-glucose pyrophosphorylase